MPTSRDLSGFGQRVGDLAPIDNGVSKNPEDEACAIPSFKIETWAPNLDG